MTTWTSTMGAALSADEEDRIAMAWSRLETLEDEDLAETHLPEPLEMLNHCTDLVMAIYELRRAINTAWNDANARRWPTPPRAKPKTRLKYLEEAKDELDALGLNPVLEGVRAIVVDDPKQLHNILTELFGEESADDQDPTDNT